ncbi:hypothetical protein BRADI_4g22245v3 [Brachypodium distachyon]|uniref:Uncharacterized protein n=1 Tax=Brachypodium distachyon TaxID=15368 RepID=A0A0Q3EN81_BRADI|nr:hypothetical protein BRADI_4g22245v3 [Brachypodium distachyon]
MRASAGGRRLNSAANPICLFICRSVPPSQRLRPAEYARFMCRYRRPSLSPPNPSGSCSNMYMHLGKAQPDWFVALICICCGCSTTHFQMPSQGRQRPLLYCQSVRIHDPDNSITLFPCPVRHGSGILLSSLLPSRTLRCSPSSTSHIVSARY